MYKYISHSVDEVIWDTNLSKDMTLMIFQFFIDAIVTYYINAAEDFSIKKQTSLSL